MQESKSGALKGVHGPVSHLLHVKEPYVTAIQTALQNSLQNIVVDTQQDGKNAINLLKRTDAGRATFLPLDAVTGNKLRSSDYVREPGFVGIACDLVEYDSRYDTVFASLLGRTVVAEDMDAAIAISRAHQNKLRIVTLDGQMLNAGGSMTGGSVARTGGILTRAAELEKLKQQDGVLSEKVRGLEADLTRQETAAEQLGTKLSQANSLLRTAEDNVLLLEGQLLQKNAILNALRNARQGLLTSQTSENLEETASLQEQQRLTAQLEADRSRLTALEQSLLQQQTLYKSVTEGAENLRQTIADITADAAALEAKNSAALAMIGQYRELIQEIDAFCAAKEQELTDSAARRSELRNTVTVLTAEKETKTGLLAGQNEQLDILRIRQKQSGEHRDSIAADIQSLGEEIIVLERQSARLEAKSAAAQMLESQIIDRLWDTYQLTRQTAKEAAVQLHSVTAAKQQVAELKRKIDRLGTVNVGAIEQYARVSERYEYLTGQRDDAQSAKRELEIMIGSISADMETVFVEQFNYINEKFGETFAEIFGGGTASVALEDESNVLDCGIEIRIQPPGKKVRSLSLLSGGERAFAAIALYFAIIKVRPTPFCIMDEIETALDEVNAQRFANYLKFISRKAQMIVITHRRPTMEAAGILYGVTMQQKGVSKVLSLALDQVEEQLQLQL